MCINLSTFQKSKNKYQLLNVYKVLSNFKIINMYFFFYPGGELFSLNQCLLKQHIFSAIILYLLMLLYTSNFVKYI